MHDRQLKVVACSAATTFGDFFERGGLDVCDAVEMTTPSSMRRRSGLVVARTHKVLDALPPGTAVQIASCPLAEVDEVGRRGCRWGGGKG